MKRIIPTPSSLPKLHSRSIPYVILEMLSQEISWQHRPTSANILPQTHPARSIHWVGTPAPPNSHPYFASSWILVQKRVENGVSAIPYVFTRAQIGMCNSLGIWMIGSWVQWRISLILGVQYPFKKKWELSEMEAKEERGFSHSLSL